MDDAVAMEVVQPNDEVRNEKFGLQFSESASPANVVSQVSAVDVVHDEVEILSVLEGVVHVDEEWVADPGEQVAFVHDRVDGLLHDDLGLVHLLHREDLLALLGLHLPHLAEAALADGVDGLEVVDGDALRRLLVLEGEARCLGEVDDLGLELIGGEVFLPSGGDAVGGLGGEFEREVVPKWVEGYMERPGDSGSLVALLVPRLWECLRSRWVLLMSLDWTYLVSRSILLELLLVSSSLILSKLIL